MKYVYILHRPEGVYLEGVAGNIVIDRDGPFNNATEARAAVKEYAETGCEFAPGSYTVSEDC